MYNNDDEETLLWSPRPDLATEEASSGNDTTSTVPWIDVISPRLNSHIRNSVEERSQNDSESERGEGSTIRLHLKTAYVAIKKLRLPGIKFPMKTTKKKKEKKNKT